MGVELIGLNVVKFEGAHCVNKNIYEEGIYFWICKIH